MAAPLRIDFLQQHKVATGTATTGATGLVSITTPFQKVLSAVATIEDASPAVTDLVVVVVSISGGTVNFGVFDSTDATAGITGTIHYIIIGH